MEQGYSQRRLGALWAGCGDLWLFILQARLQQYVNRELPDVQTGFRKAEESTLLSRSGGEKGLRLSGAGDRKSTRLNSSHSGQSRMPSSA